jgi:hypothetical protein
VRAGPKLLYLVQVPPLPIVQLTQYKPPSVNDDFRGWSVVFDVRLAGDGAVEGV